MSALLRPAVRAVGITIAAAAVAGAQDKSCEVNESRPTAVGRATLAVQVAQSTQDPAAAAKQLSAAVKGLTENAERMENQAGRNLVLGKALVLWSLQPNVELVTTRGALGYTSNPTGSIDLVAAIDSAFKVVETSNPECVAETARWRGQKPWVTLVNQAIEKLNAEDIDAASAAADRAIQLNPFGPYGYVIKGQILQKRQRATEAFEMYRKGIQTAAADTAYTDIRRQSIVYLGNLAADSAEMASDAAAKRPYIEAARSAFDQILKDPGATEFRANAQSGMCRVMIASGDTSALRQVYSEPITNPGALSYADLMNAGVCLARAEMVPEATKIFRSALEKNTHHRDALSNLAIMLVNAENFDEAVPVAVRLVAVEPNNPENLQLLVMSYAGIAKRTRDQRSAGSKAATKTGAKTGATKTGAKTAAPPGPRLSAAVIDSLFKVEAAYTDSAVKANERREKLTLKVSLNEFTSTEEKAVVGGTVQNSGSEARTVTMKVEFLDRTGKVISTKDVEVNAPAGRAARFQATVTPGNKEITAFRYAPLQ